MAVAPPGRMGLHESIWGASAARLRFPAFTSDDEFVDVAIVGGGITGLTTALLLALEGKSVAVLEARRLGAGVTGRTTAHLTAVLDTRYYTLEKAFGREGAKLAAESNAGAIRQIEAIVERYAIDCELERVPGYLFTERAEKVDELAHELVAVEKIGMEAEPASLPEALPLHAKAVIRFPGQAQFHPLKYIRGVAEALVRAGHRLFEETRVLSVDEGEPCTVHLENGATLRAEHVILATHAPLNAVLLQPRLAQYRSYVVSGPVPHAPNGLFWDVEDPYHYVRSRRGDVPELIVGGGDHKTGKHDRAGEGFDEVVAFAARLGLGEPTRAWSAQVVEPVDGLPFIGANLRSERVFVATGFSGNGMTFGTVAAQVLRDLCLGRGNRFADLYSTRRLKPLASLPSLLGENVDYPLHLLSDRVRPPDARRLEDIAPGEGKIVRVGGARLAVYRDETGALHALSPICTHMGCHVAFNAAERSWDCPCHGSRFDTRGAVLDGPATRPLANRSSALPKQ